MIKDFSEQPYERLCLNCEKELFGRLDKKFCNDTCRNNFNRRRKTDHQQELSPEAQRTMRLIRKNYDILRRLSSHRKLPCVISKHELTEQNFHFKFCTSIYQNQHKEIYFYCFEYGWKKTPDDKIMLVYSDEQVWI